ncbi:C4-type zinc ribbon domain-containing protein [Angustibacter speluncae]
MTTANALDQVRLLDVQALDTRLRQLAHRRRTLPETARLAELDAERAALRDRLVQARTVVGDVERELRKAEADVEQVSNRAARDRARLEAGTGSAKDLQGLQHELESLGRRQSELEDVELEVMERLERAQGEVAGLERALATAEEQTTEVTASQASAFGEIDTEAGQVTAQRDEVAAGLDPALVTLYDKVREQTGVGAAMLRGKRCEGCRMELTPVELARIAKLPPDEVVRCEECRTILVRTTESGL